MQALTESAFGGVRRIENIVTQRREFDENEIRPSRRTTRGNPGSVCASRVHMTTVAAFADRVWLSWVAHDPLVALVPKLDTAGMGTYSLAEAETTADTGRHLLAELDRVNVATDSRDAATMGYLRWLLGTWTEAVDRYWYESPVAPYTGLRRINASLAALGQYEFGRRADVDGYLELLTHHARAVAQIRETLHAQESRGIRIFRAAHATARQSVADWGRRLDAAAHPDDSRLVRLDPGVAQQLHDGIDRSLATQVHPAYADVLEFLGGEYADRLPDEVGYGQFTGGEQFYRMMARARTTTDYSVEEIHAIGREQVSSAADRMAEIRANLGFSGSEREFHERLRADSRLFARRPAEVRERYERHVSSAASGLGTLFAAQQEASYEIVRLDAGLEPSMTYGYYRYPTPSVPRGAYLFNGSQLRQRSLISSASLILHELVPGHHLQIGRQLENASLPDVRREPVLAVNAFIEGWAEYAAGLGWELGAYADPYDAYGRLAMERFFAQRLVVDTGMNCLGWSLEHGRDYMRENTLESDTQIASETIRYSTDTPGQALAYGLGFLEFNRLRESATHALGARFDIRAFHEQVLEPGALPLPVCSAQIDRWIESRAEPSGA